MAKVTIYDMTGKSVGERELNDAIFAVTPNKAVLHEVVKNYLANQRQGTQSTLTRTEVSGGGKKPWRQKGTGHARQGSTRAPQWTHGGVALGPKPRSYRYTINRKMKGKEDFTEQQYEHLHQMFELTADSLTQMNVLLTGRRENCDANRSFNIENEINNYRNQLKSQNINDVNDHKYDYAIGTMYMDMISECEKLGDYVVNVVEARMGTRKPEA